MRDPGEGQTVAALSQHLQEKAGNYFPDLGEGEVGVILLNERRRTNSALYRFRLVGDATRVVLVKVPSLRGGLLRDARPYLVPEIDPSIKYRVQHAALVALYAHFGDLADPRFGAVRPLDLIPEHAAFVMDEVPGRTLQQLVARSSRLRSPFEWGEIRGSFENTGAWLRAFHEMPVETNAEMIHPKCSDFVQLVEEFTGFLGRSLKDEPFFCSVAEKAKAMARDALQGSLPLGLRFGDFGLTNVLVAADGRVTGIDTLATWYAPIYEDIAYFLTGFKTYRAQILSLGFGFGKDRIAALESAFLKGYFQRDRIPLRELRLYEVLRLLERWSAKLARARNRSGAGARLGAALLNRFLRRTVSSLLQEAYRP